MMSMSLRQCFCLLSCILFSAGSLSKEDSAASFVGAETCAGCHAQQYSLWKGSHHDWAMQPANEQSVLGDFNQVSFEHYGERSEFYRQGDSYYIKTQNAEGKMQAFKVAYTFGFYPLQQYLIPFPDGRMQALSVAWDSRPKEEGGQRWFHLYPDEAIPFDDVLHWTGPYFTWNTRCAECHSTQLKRNYQASDNTYKSTWSEVNVACEACHGAGSQHVQQANAGQLSSDSGLTPINAVGAWLRDSEAATATHRAPPAGTQVESASEQLAVCGSCHSRRALVDDLDKPGNFHNQHQLQLLAPGLYSADGQIQDEVYVLGSFLQSKMHKEGVVCSNCHEPHRLKLRAEGNGVCAQCHNPQVFDTAKHHHHPEGAGSQCANCHMPEHTYMVVDPRRDHSIRIPRPDLSERTGSPNACNLCHQDQSNEWSSAALNAWLKVSGKKLEKHYGEAFASFRAGDVDGDLGLIQLAMNPDTAPIVGASALAQVSLSQESLHLARLKVNDPSPLLRRSAILLLEQLPLEQRQEVIFPLLSDPIKMVRTESARVLAGAMGLEVERQRILDQAIAEYRSVLLLHQDTASGQLNIAGLELALQDMTAAEKAYHRALLLDSRHVGARLNLADFYRSQQQDHKGEPLLRESLELTPEHAGPPHALGLLLVRQKKYEEALQYLSKAYALAPENSRYAYIYAVAANTVGNATTALEVLERVVQREPANQEALMALVDILNRQGQQRQALKYAESLLRLTPENTQLKQWVDYLRSRGLQ